MRRAIALALLALLAVPGPAVHAQDPGQVESLANILMAQDRRAFDAVLFGRAVTDPDSLVRRAAALAISRIGDLRGTPLLIPLLADRAPGVAGDVMFALGLLRDTSAVAPIIKRLALPDLLDPDAVSEAATALARIGGVTAARFIGDVLSGGGDILSTRRNDFRPNAVLDAWRLGRLAPVGAIQPILRDTSVDMRWRAVYTLGRLRTPSAAVGLFQATSDRDETVRGAAVAALTRRYVDSTTLSGGTVKNALAHAFDDDRPSVRINALKSAASFRDSTLASKATPLLDDLDLNVQVATASLLGSLGAKSAAKELNAVFDRRNASWALKRAALDALAHLDTAMFARRAAVWLASADPRERAAALAGWGVAAPASPAVFAAALTDRDVYVQGVALAAWQAAHPHGDSALASVMHQRLRHADPGIRAAAADAIRNVATADDLDALLAGWRASTVDPDYPARLAMLRALHALADRDATVMAKLEEPSRRDILVRPADPVVLAEASRTWPALARYWGAPGPIDTKRSLEDYRTIARTYMLASTNPHVTIEVEGKGSIDVELFPHDAPMAVANFLQLVDRHYFDGIRWFRVEPNFVIQTGDRTSTGEGMGTGRPIRDEINRERYSYFNVGMALDGPDTGETQWFIILSAQPHLDGGYTVFGRVSGTYTTMPRIVQGDMIRSIHR